MAIGYRDNLPITDPEVLVSTMLTTPELGPHDLCVEVEAVSVNPVDVKLRAGAPSGGFRVLGFDAAGTVRGVGDEVTLFAPGDEVFYAGSIDRPGSNQRMQVVDERIVGRKPTRLDFAEAASLPLTSITAWESLCDRLALTSRCEGILLVVGASGGVGAMVVQLARVLFPKVRIIATASDGSRADWVRSLGAHRVVDHHADMVEQVARIAPDGVDWLFTAYSEGQIDRYARMLRPFGHIVAIDDGPRDISPLKTKSLSWHWELMFTRPMLGTPDMEGQHRLLNAVTDMVDAGLVRPTVTRTLGPISVESLREAHALVEDGHMMGKVVVQGW